MEHVKTERDQSNQKRHRQRDFFPRARRLFIFQSPVYHRACLITRGPQPTCKHKGARSYVWTFACSQWRSRIPWRPDQESFWRSSRPQYKAGSEVSPPPPKHFENALWVPMHFSNVRVYDIWHLHFGNFFICSRYFVDLIVDLDVMDNWIIYCLAFSFKSLVQRLINFISWCILSHFLQLLEL